MEKTFFWKKKIFFWKKLFFGKKNIFLEKNFFLEKKIFSGKKNIFWKKLVGQVIGSRVAIINHSSLETITTLFLAKHNEIFLIYAFL